MPLKASQAIFGMMLVFGLLFWGVSLWNWTFASAYMRFSLELSRGQLTFHNSGADAQIGLKSDGFSGIATDWLPVDGFYSSIDGQWQASAPVWFVAAVGGTGLFLFYNPWISATSGRLRSECRGCGFDIRDAGRKCPQCGRKAA